MIQRELSPRGGHFGRKILPFQKFVETCRVYLPTTTNDWMMVVERASTKVMRTDKSNVDAS